MMLATNKEIRSKEDSIRAARLYFSRWRIEMKPETNALKVSVIWKSDPIKEMVHFCYYPLAKGIRDKLAFAKKGTGLWFRTKRPACKQLCPQLLI